MTDAAIRVKPVPLTSTVVNINGHDLDWMISASPSEVYDELCLDLGPVAPDAATAAAVVLYQFNSNVASVLSDPKSTEAAYIGDFVKAAIHAARNWPWVVEATDNRDNRQAFVDYLNVCMNGREFGIVEVDAALKEFDTPDMHQGYLEANLSDRMDVIREDTQLLLDRANNIATLISW